jgi:hypothetical protein
MEEGSLEVPKQQLLDDAGQENPCLSQILFSHYPMKAEHEFLYIDL